MTDSPLDPFSEVLDERRKWMPDWYGWLQRIISSINDLETSVSDLEEAQAHGFFWVNRNGNNQGSLTGNADNKIQFTNEVYDVESYFDNATNYRYTPLLAGIYEITLAARGTYAADQAVVAAVYKNGSSVARGSFHSPDTTTDSRSVVTTVVALNGSSDFIEGFIRMPATPTVIRGETDSTFMFGYRLRGL